MSATRSPKRFPKLRLLHLEDRCVPANIVVNIAGEDPNPGHGMVSFRDALAIANSDNQPDTITFAPGITTVAITDPADLMISEAGQPDKTVIDGGGVVVLQRDGSATTQSLLTVGKDAVAELRGLTVTGGNSTWSFGGGGLFVGEDAQATLKGVTIRGNRTSGANGGGGIAVIGSVTLINSQVVGNTADATGGGISSGGVVILQSSTVARNTAGANGGGVFALYGPNPTKLVAINSTISDNLASDPSPLAYLRGGGIYASAYTTLTNVTITNNRVTSGRFVPASSQQGGGLDLEFGGTIIATLNNTIVSGNFSGNGNTADDVSGSGEIDPSSSHNLIGGDAMLGPLADNGGPTLTHALLPGSPAIDAGSNALAVDQNGHPLTTDQRGFVRISGGTVDIGAYEFQHFGPASGDTLTVVGCLAGATPMVNVYDAEGGLVASFLAFGPGFRGGVNVAVADVNGDGVPDIIAGAGAGGGPQVNVFDGSKLWMTRADGELSSSAMLASFFAYGAGFRGGVSVAAGDVNGDGKADIITGAGPGGGPHVEVFSGAGGTTLASFFAYAAGFHGGVNVAAGDVNGDGKADIVTGAGAGGGPHVKLFDGGALATGGSTAAAAIANPFKSFFAFSPAFTGGVNVAVGDVSGDGHADIITGAGAGGPHVRAFDASSLANVANFFAGPATFLGGVHVATAMHGSDPTLSIVTGAGVGSSPMVEVFNGSSTPVASITAFDPSFLGGVSVA